MQFFSKRGYRAWLISEVGISFSRANDEFASPLTHRGVTCQGDGQDYIVFQLGKSRRAIENHADTATGGHRHAGQGDSDARNMGSWIRLVKRFHMAKKHTAEH